MVMTKADLWNSGRIIQNILNGKKIGRQFENLAYLQVENLSDKAGRYLCKLRMGEHN